MFRSLLSAAAICALVSPSLANITVDITTSTDGSSVANSLNVTTTDTAWSGAQLLVQLTQGSVVNLDTGLGGVDYSPSQAQLNTIPALQFDTYIGRVGQFDQPAGEAYELGGAGPWSLGPAGINVDWFGSAGSHSPSIDLPIANLVFTDDAQGTWSLRLAQPGLQTVTLQGGTLADGELLTDFVPGDLTRDGFVGVADLNNVLSYWNQAPPVVRPAYYDPTYDNYVGIADLNYVLGSWNHGTPQQPWPENTAGDLDSDGFVGVGDINVVLGNWHQNVTPGDLLSGDPSGDGFVGFDDLVIVNALWHTGTPPATLPEPASLALFVLSGITVLKRH